MRTGRFLRSRARQRAADPSGSADYRCILTFEIDLMCLIEACVAAAGILYLFNGLARLPLPRPSFRKNLSFLGHLSQSDIFPFLSFFRKTTKKKVTFSDPAPGVERRVLDSDLARSSHQNKPGFSGISSLCSLSSIVSFRESRPSPNSPSTLSDGVSSKEIYNPAPGRITPLSAPKPVPRVNKRVFV